MPLPISTNKEAACAAGMLCQASDHANINSSMHHCLNCRGEIHSAMWCSRNWGNYIMPANCWITLDQLTAAVRSTVHDSDHKLITICNVWCVNSLENPNSLNESHLDKQTAATLASSTTKMTVSTVEKHVRVKSPIVSLANKINAKTAAKKRVNKSGEVVSAVKVKEPRIGIGVWVFSTKSQLISLVKQGNPWYENLWSATSNGFWFYGTVLRGDTWKGWWHVEYDLFPSYAKSMRISRRLCSTIASGQDEPSYQVKNDKINEALKQLEMIDSEPPGDDLNLVLWDSDDDEEGMSAPVAVAKRNKKQKKRSRKIQSLESFLDMSDNGVLHSDTFDHYYGEGNNQYIHWVILKDGNEITKDIMEHCSDSSFRIYVPWSPETSFVNYFNVFFKYFFPLLEGKAAVLDRYLSNPSCSGYQGYWVHEKVRFYRPERPDPDYILKVCVTLVIAAPLDGARGLAASSYPRIMGSTFHSTTFAHLFVDFHSFGVQSICGIQSMFLGIVLFHLSKCSIKSGESYRGWCIC
jgi:hypothetical protein